MGREDFLNGQEGLPGWQGRCPCMVKEDIIFNMNTKEGLEAVMWAQVNERITEGRKEKTCLGHCSFPHIKSSNIKERLKFFF